MNSLEAIFTSLQSSLVEGTAFEALRELGYHPLIEEHELLLAGYALLAERHALCVPLPPFKPLPSGALPLYEYGFFPWKSLPYPREHALLGALLAQFKNGEMKRIAKEMIPFQEATVDHRGKSLTAIFSQEGSAFDLDQANHDFFQTVDHTPLSRADFFDSTLGIVAQKRENATVLCFGSGCKSGMGIFLHNDGGVINFGPQLLPIGDCSGFGLAGRGENISLTLAEEHFALSYRCRMAGLSQRVAGLFPLRDSGFSGFWIDAKLEGGPERMKIECEIEGISSIDKLAFSFFGKAKTCVVARTHQLSPKSLDRYAGPPQIVTLGDVEIEAQEGLNQMELIPLAADSSYWGADFLIAFRPQQPKFSFLLKKKQNKKFDLS